MLLEGALNKNILSDILMIIFNIFLDFCLVYYIDLGIISIALSTVIARIIQFIISLSLLSFGKTNQIKLNSIFKTKINFKDYKIIFVLAYYGLSLVFNMAGQSIYFLTFVCVRLNIDSIYYLSIFGAISPVVNFLNSTIVGRRKKIVGFFSFSSGTKNWIRFKEAYFALTFYSLITCVLVYFILAFAIPNEILKTFKVFYNADEVTLLKMQLCTTLSLLFIIPTKPVFDNTGRVGIDLFLQLFRRYGFFIPFLIIFSFTSN